MRPARLLLYPASSVKTLAENEKHVFAADHALQIYGANAIYSYIPKNACSTLRFTLALANGCIRGEEDINWIHANNETFKASLREIVTADYTFVVLRCPFSRLASCYVDKIAYGSAVRRFYFKATDRNMRRTSFEAFVEDLQEKDLLKRNAHWRPQTDFLVYAKYDDYFCVEDFARASAALKERIGLQVHDARHLTGHGTDGYKKTGGQGEFAAASGLDIVNMKAEGIVPDVRALYSDRAIEIVSAMYADDLRLYREKTGRMPLFDR